MSKSLFSEHELFVMYQSAVQISSHPRCAHSAQYVFQTILDEETQVKLECTNN